MKMSRIFRVFFAMALFTALALPQLAQADKRVKADPDAPTPEQAKALGWGPVKTPNRGKSPEFLVRGILMDITKEKEPKDTYTVKILPIEIVNNNQRVLGFDNFVTGVDITMQIGKETLKGLEKGHMVEYNQYYTESVAQAIGGAKMVDMTMHHEIQGYPKGADPYLASGEFYPVQYKNAIKALAGHEDILKPNPNAKTVLDYLATKSTDPELKTLAKDLYVKIWSSEPTGKCTMAKATGAITCK